MTPAIKTQTPIDQLFAARTAADIQAILNALPDAYWRPLGDRPNNYAPVNVGAEPADGWAEKVINGIDAIVENEVELARDYEVPDPRTAAETYLGVPGGHIWDLAPDLRRALAERLTVTVRSGSATDPTIVVEDTGIGQHPDDFPATLLSLNESNKRDKLYLMGAYGWGGASSYAFATYTIFVSRRNPDLLGPGKDDVVGWTVVRYNPLNEDRFSKTGVYEYLVLPGNPGAVRRFSPSELPEKYRDWHGTHVTMIDYRLGRYSSAAAWEPKESLYVLGNAIMFDPVMPFLLRDERPKSVEKSANSLRGMVINGTATKLMDLRKKRRPTTDDAVDPEADEKVTYFNTYRGRLSTGGVVTIRYWVLGESGKYKKDWQPTRPYVMPDQAVTITHNGQRHMTYPRALFERLGMMTLSKAMLVHVETDALDWHEKRQLFSTTRDRLKESPITDELRRQLDTTLRSDDALTAEDRRRKERARARGSRAQAEKIMAKLAKAIEALRQGTVQKFRAIMSTSAELPLYTDQPLVDPPERPTTDTDDGPMDESADLVYEGAPTFVRVLNAPIRVPAGGRAVVRLAIDAADDYFAPNPGSFLTIVSKGKDAFSILGFSDVKSGRMRCTISAANASTGDRGRIIFTVISPDGALPLVEEVDLEATEPPAKRVKPAGRDDGKVKGGPKVEQVFKSEWGLYDFDGDTIAKIEGNPTDANMLTIYVNMDYQPVVAALMSQKKATPEMIEGYQEGYAAHMAFVAWLQNQEEKTETLNQAEMRRAAQAWAFTLITAD